MSSHASGFNCTVDRHSGDTTDQMYLINHYLYTPSTLVGGNTPVPNNDAVPHINAVSSVGSLSEEAGTTFPTLHSRAPTFPLVDLYDWGSGSVFQVAASLNGVQYVAKSIAAQNGTNASSSSGSSSTSTSTKNGADQAVMAGRSSVVVGACAVFGSFMALWSS
ncbi:hypothetical protein FRB94_005194 [Tulasnella sp. JGI-2019a]|nr:hypothetical protein FRB93_003177 [Tulasnella sp. JGI-2019a]KAG9000727.1 hypothetical protein FRB94_005194 [Tulasnella sp. JGI-2019a]